MPFTCPACSVSRSLTIDATLELPPDSRSDEIAVQLIHCSRCDFTGIAVYEESRRGSLDSESVDHYGYSVSAAELDDIRELIRFCPAPRKPRCNCAAHRQLGARNASGRWSGLREIRRRNSFPIRR